MGMDSSLFGLNICVYKRWFGQFNVKTYIWLNPGLDRYHLDLTILSWFGFRPGSL